MAPTRNGADHAQPPRSMQACIGRIRAPQQANLTRNILRFWRATAGHQVNCPQALTELGGFFGRKAHGGRRPRFYDDGHFHYLRIRDYGGR
jgi:hypothetical protein